MFASIVPDAVHLRKYKFLLCALRNRVTNESIEVNIQLGIPPIKNFCLRHCEWGFNFVKYLLPCFRFTVVFILRNEF